MKFLYKSSHIKPDLLFLLRAFIHLMALQSLFRGILLWRNSELGTAIPSNEIVQSFFVGMRFDLIMTAYVMIPLVLTLLHPAGIRKKWATIWLTFVAVVFTFFAIVELDFYHEFHVRLNSLAFQYIKEDTGTVLSMIWYGFPVVRYLLLVAVISSLFYFTLSRSHKGVTEQAERASSYAIRLGIFCLVAASTVLAGRGTLRQGPPLRWGDAFHSEYLFANHLALNGSFTLTKAFISEFKYDKQKQWLKKMPKAEAVDVTRKLLFTEKDSLIKGDHSPIYRTYHAGEGVSLSTKPLNVVMILMESFSAEFVGSLGHKGDITPEFDKLREEGLLFKNFFSNGTHTHQGMFASMACFPNLPGFSYLMQQPEGDTKFAGVLKFLGDRNYQSLYVYNGDFAWDNQRGFFGGQGMQRFIGRNDFINPKFSDPTWGVSDEDMFNRSAEELAKIPEDTPFFALLQSLSNHTPYALPDPLPVEQVTGFSELNEHLTAMRYSDWALGEFFKKAKQSKYYDNTVFLVLGDHGFGTSHQLTGIDLLRFHVPLLVIGPNVVSTHGSTSLTVGSQVDLAPTIAGLTGGDAAHGCWGRDLMDVKDKGFAVIKPSGSDSTTAFIDGNKVLVKQPRLDEKLYSYSFEKKSTATLISDATHEKDSKHKLNAFIQLSMDSLLHGKAGYK